MRVGPCGCSTSVLKATGESVLTKEEVKRRWICSRCWILGPKSQCLMEKDSNETFTGGLWHEMFVHFNETISHAQLLLCRDN